MSNKEEILDCETETQSVEPENQINDSPSVAVEESAPDTRSHLTSSVPRTASAPRGGMSAAELHMARELFSGLSDAQIHRLYKKVTQ